MSVMWARLSALACATRPDLLDTLGRRLFDIEPCALPIVSPEDEIVTATTTTVAASITAALPLPLPEPYFFATIDTMTSFLSWLSLLTLLFGFLLALGTIGSRAQFSTPPPPLSPQPTTITADSEPSNEIKSLPHSPLVAHALLRLALVSQMHPMEPVPEAEWRQPLTPNNFSLLNTGAMQMEPVTDSDDDEGNSDEHSSEPQDDMAASEGSEEEPSPEPLCSDAESDDDDEESIPEPTDDFSYLDGEDVSGNNMPTLDADQYTLDKYPPEGKTYLSAWNLISKDSDASEMHASDDSETVYDPVPPPKSVDEERSGVYTPDARIDRVIDAVSEDQDRLDLDADDSHKPSADVPPEVLPTDQLEPSDAPETPPAVQKSAEVAINLLKPPSLASEVYASLTLAKSHTKGHLHHDVAVLTLAFWMGFDHADETDFVPQAVVEQCSFLDTFPAFIRKLFANRVEEGMDFAAWENTGDQQYMYNWGVQTATQVILEGECERVDDILMPRERKEEAFAYIAGWRASMRELCAAGPRTRKALDIDCFEYGLNALRDGEVIAKDVLCSMDQTQLEDFLTATSHVLLDSAMRSIEKEKWLGTCQALYGADRREERCQTIQNFTLEELAKFRGAYLEAMLLLIRLMGGSEYLGPFNAVVPKRFTVADFAKNYFAHAGSGKCDAETCATRFKHMTSEEMAEFLEEIWDEIGDIWAVTSNTKAPSIADFHSSTLEEYEESSAGSPQSSRASSPAPSEDESDMYDVCPLSPQPPLPLSENASRAPSPAPTQAVVERAPTPTSPLPPPSPSPPPPPPPPRSEKYLMGHAHAVEGFAHNPLGLTTRFFAARDWDAPTFDDYRRGWLAGMLELVARTAGAPHDGLGAPRAWCCGMGLPTWVDQDPKTPDELVGFIKKMTPSDIGAFLRKGWKKLGEKGRKNGRYDYAGPCDIDVVHLGEPSLNEKIEMALAFRG
uniref:Uncharacterized protein n=1 Tax=Schizophyllum commune (strain H4-8 / FGSC 9210) TaxID=578458 RepID=D8QIS3_SCHCM